MKSSGEPVTIGKGICHVLYAFDIGRATNLSKCLERIPALGGHATLLNKNRRAPKYFGFDPQPLSVVQVSREIPSIGGRELSRAVSLTFYDFGALSISYDIPVSGALADLRDLSIAVDESETLPAEARRRASNVTKALGDAIDHPLVSVPVEDYLIFEIGDFELGGPAATLHERAGALLAQVLRAERRSLSESETADALTCRISYGDGDVTLVDWNAAMIFDRDAEDIRSVLEFANIELLELRFLDYQLDSSLDTSFELSARPQRLLRLVPGWTPRIARRISTMQLEGAILFERVSNAPKLLGDQFLARVYRLASQRFHVSEWNSSILRKLDTIEDFYKQIHDTAASQRLEMLEWIIIALIFLEILISLVPGVMH
ncbi:MAG TPA: hypothetical protein VLX68_01780 [Chitinivibrionales bacterium]|nr:hypothetical protein [Chitinivibrionales bacterium]